MASPGCISYWLRGGLETCQSNPACLGGLGSRLSHGCDWRAGDPQWEAVDADRDAGALMEQITNLREFCSFDLNTDIFDKTSEVFEMDTSIPRLEHDVLQQ